MPPVPSDNHPLLAAAAGVAVLIFLIAALKWNAFLALFVAALSVGVLAGMEPVAAVTSFGTGLGKTMESVAVVIGLGAMIGRLLADSGGAAVIAQTLARVCGPRHLPWALFLAALVIGLPAWFAVGVVLLAPVVLTVVREGKHPLPPIMIPVLAGLSVMHGLVPPHPGPVAAIGALGADAGKTLLWSLIIGIPTAVISGPWLARWLRLPAGADLAEPVAATPANVPPNGAPGFGATIFTLVLPALLMLAATLGKLVPALAPAKPWLMFVGNPAMAMLIATLWACWVFGRARGFTRDQVLRMLDQSVAPVAIILLIVGAGGGFNTVLNDTGAAKALADLARSSKLSPLILGWLVAAAIRVATGSATVAINAAAGVLAELARQTPGLNLELLILAMGAGSLTLSHLNDGGFWFVKESFRLSIPGTLKTWTVMETVISVAALALVLLADVVLKAMGR